MRNVLMSLAVIGISGVMLLGQAQAKETAVPLDKLPKAVTEAVKKMFPKAELRKATQEKDDGETEYEVTIKNEGKMIDVTVDADGDIEGLEKEVDLKDLPKAVKEAVKEAVSKAYPKAVQKSAEAVYEIEDGKEELKYYEIRVKAEDGKEVEVKVKTDGTLVTDADDDDGGKAEPKK